MTRETIGIAMSGGVDSSVSAAILQRQGFDVHGFLMLLPLASGTEEQVLRVRALAGNLGIPLHLIDLRKRFADRVIRYFVESYVGGSTPNPCVICNEQVKFGFLLQEMRNRGMARMATGHYARIGISGEGKPLLCRGLDPLKDQSYFLCRLTADTLSYLVFPLGGLSKNEVYLLAAEIGLSGVHGPESQDVCFLAGTSVAAFIADQGIPTLEGDIITDGGKVIGRHSGLWRYTVGQRRGLDLPDASPWYVRKLDARNNRLLVCKKDELLLSSACLKEVRWQGLEPALPWRGLAQIRGRHRPVPATLAPAGVARWRLEFDQPQRAVTPGQFAVFYQDEIVCGSGIIVADEDDHQRHVS